MDLHSQFDTALSGRLCLTLVHSLWQIGLLAMIVWGIDRLWKRQATEKSYALCVAAMLLGLVMLPLTYMLVEIEGPDGVLASDHVQRDASQTISPVIAPEMYDRLGQTAAESSKTFAADTPTTLPETKFRDESNAAWTWIAPWMAVSYFVGVFLMLVRFGVGLWRAQRLTVGVQVIAEGPFVDLLNSLAEKWTMRIMPTLARAEQIVIPTVVGIVRPTILLPASAFTGMSAEQLEMILAHELAHVRRYDMWVNLLQRIAESVLFFNPALWFLSRRIGTLREYCCDELACQAMEQSPNDSRIGYAQALLRVVELSKNPGGRGLQRAELASLAVGGQSPSQLARRISRLCGEPIDEPLRATRGTILAVVVLVSALLAGPIMLTTEAAPEANAVTEIRREMPQSVELNVIPRTIPDSQKMATDYVRIAQNDRSHAIKSVSSNIGASHELPVDASPFNPTDLDNLEFFIESVKGMVLAKNTSQDAYNQPGALTANKHVWSDQKRYPHGTVRWWLDQSPKGVVSRRGNKPFKSGRSFGQDDYDRPGYIPDGCNGKPCARGGFVPDGEFGKHKHHYKQPCYFEIQPEDRFQFDGPFSVFLLVRPIEQSRDFVYFGVFHWSTLRQQHRDNSLRFKNGKMATLTGPDAVTIGAWQLIEVHRDQSNALRCVVNGRDLTLGNPSVDGPFRMCTIMNNNQAVSKQADPFAGDLAAFVLYSDVLAERENQAVRGYFDSLYKFKDE